MRSFVVLLMSGALAAPMAADAAPRLRLVGTSSLTVVGSGFRPGERVRLLVTPGPRSRSLRAGSRGGFRVVLPMLAPPCGGLVVQAFGGAGSRATVDGLGLDCSSVDR